MHGEHGERLLKRGRSHLVEFETVQVAMSAEALEGPRQVSLGGDSDGATSRDDAEQDGGTVCPLSAPSKEHVEPELGDVLELPLGR